MAIKREDVRYVADLARIELDEKELEHFTLQLGRILEYVDKLKALDLSNLLPTSHVLEMKNVYREDSVRKSLPMEDALKNAPDTKNDLFRVQRII